MWLDIRYIWLCFTSPNFRFWAGVHGNQKYLDKWKALKIAQQQLTLHPPFFITSLPVSRQGKKK